MLRLERQRPENQEIERPLRQIDPFVAHVLTALSCTSTPAVCHQLL
jgi:hypothetical protein